jgi:hypothetical protein
MLKNRAAEGPSTVSVLLFALLLALCLAIAGLSDADNWRAAERTECPERFVPQGHLISEGPAHSTPIKYLSY